MPLPTCVIALATCAVFAQGCGRCQPTVVKTVPAPDRRYVAVVETYECGAMAPFNSHVRIGRSPASTTTVARVVEAPYSVDVRWRDDRRLLLVVECMFDSHESCSKPAKRHWTFDSESSWQDVQIGIEAGPKALRYLGPDALQRLRE